MALPQTQKQWDDLGKDVASKKGKKQLLGMYGLGGSLLGPSPAQRLQQSQAAQQQMINAALMAANQSKWATALQIRQKQQLQNQQIRRIYGGTATTATSSNATGSLTNSSTVSGTILFSGTTTAASGTSVYWSRSDIDDVYTYDPRDPRSAVSAVPPRQKTLADYSFHELLYELKRRKKGKMTLPHGVALDLELPDRTNIKVEFDGSFKIEDKDAKVVYAANRFRDFNSFINASDKVEGFIDFCAAQGVTKEEMIDIPIKLFINWLVVEAAKADRETPPDLPLLPPPKTDQLGGQLIWI